MQPLFHKLHAILILTFFLCACSTAETQTAQDPGSLTILETSPGDGATNVAVNTIVAVTFSEEMDSQSITQATFFVSGPLGPIAGTITYGGTVATFTPDQALAFETTYEITVTTGVRDRAGNHLVADYTSTFSTIAQAKMWGIPISIEGLPDDAGDVRVAMDPHGNGIAIWVQRSTTGGTPSLWFNRYLTNGGWQGENRIETGLGVVPWVGTVACDQNGNIFVIWEESTGLGGDFYGVSVRRYDASTGQWGPSRSLTEVSGQRDVRRNPKLAVDGNGNAFVVWEDSSSGLGGGIVYVNRYDQATDRWSGKEVLADFAFEPEVAVDQVGNGVAIWAQHSHSVDGIYAKRYDTATGLWTPAEHLSNEGIFYAGSPRLTVSPAGDAIVAWVQADQFTFPSRIWTNRFDVSLGQWKGADVFASTDVSAENPAIGSDDAGNAVLIWQRKFNPGVWATRYVSGAGWETPFLLIDAPPLAQLAVAGDGNAIIVGSLANTSWGEPFRASIYAMNYEAGSDWGPRIQIGGSDGVASFPQVAMNQGRQTIVVWLQQGADFTGSWDVWSNRFE